MLTGGIDRRDATAVLLTLVLLVSGFGTAIGSIPAAAAGDRPPAESGAAGPGPTTPEPGVVHPDLQDAAGEVTVVVRFRELGDGPAPDGPRRERGTRMRTQAADTQAAFDEFAAAHAGVTVDRSFWVANAKLVTVDTDAVALADLASVEGVREIHPNYRVEATAAATDAHPVGLVDTLPNVTDLETDESGAEDYRTTYGLEQIRAPEVWARFGTKGAGVSVAVLDSGVDPAHPDLDVDESRWAEFDDAGDRVGSTPYDSDDHGTHTSGTVAGGNASGTHVGVAPEATLYHGKVLDGDFGSWAAIIAGIEWAATEAEVDVISMSLGADTYQSAFFEPIRRANDLGVIVVASAGNNGQGASNSPGNVYDTISVAAVDEDRDVASLSGGERVRTADAWGSDAPADWPDEYVVPAVAAPGVDVRSTEPGGGYVTKTGTSMAVPHVAGVVALIRAAGGDHLSQSEMRALLARTARKPAGAPRETDTRYGAGVVDAYAATARGTADSTVTGRVVDADGNPVSDSRVDTEFGYGEAADADGAYRLAVPSLEQRLTVEAFGHEPETVTVAPAAETLQRDVVLSDPTLAARGGSTSPRRVDPGETVTYEFAVSNVSAVTVDVLAGTRVDQGQVTLEIDGETVAFGQRRTYEDPKVNENVTVTVETTAGTVGALELAHTFEDGSGSVTRRTPRTHVHPDPLRVPADYDPADLQTAVDVAAPGTTVLLDERASRPYSLSVDGGTTDRSGLTIGKPLTLAATPGAAPVLSVADHDGSATVVAVESTAPDVTLRGLTVDGHGADVGLRATGSADLTDAAVRDATVDVDLRAQTRARNVSLGGRAVDFDARGVTITATTPPAAPPAGQQLIGPAYDVGVVGASPRADLSIAYDGADVAGIQEGTLRTWRHDETAGTWTAVADSRVETADRRVVASLDPSGTFVPMGEREPADGELNASAGDDYDSERGTGDGGAAASPASPVDGEGTDEGATGFEATPIDARSTPRDEPSPTATPGGDGAPTDGTTESATRGPASPTEGDGAGFGVVVALLAALAGLVGARRRAP